jgi:hypothetical protein
MLTELQFDADRSAKVDHVLSHYLQTHPFELNPAACPAWRDGDVIPREQLTPEASELRPFMPLHKGVQS